VKTSQFDYYLPARLIAQTPEEPRDHSRLMVVDRNTDKIEHTFFHQIGNYLYPGDLLVVNRTRVIPARVFAQKPTGGKVEILLLRKEDDLTWEVLLGGKKVRIGSPLIISDGLIATPVKDLGSSRRLVSFDHPIEEYLKEFGQMPLPPYIHQKLVDAERYQTVYADRIGSAAAPTAGLHFTHQLLDNLKVRGIEIAEVTLHVGLDTFLPVNEENAEDHIIHSEWCEIDETTAEKINIAHREKRHIIAVGTTSVRTLESAANREKDDRIVEPFSGTTNLFILPGYTFSVIDGMITNFHLPRSTLLMMVSAFAGWEKISRWYEIAIKEGYRFYSFGDAMFIQ
jgi:S-adenosylmethionine:tRNA ribosyltransferase-isomerase